MGKWSCLFLFLLVVSVLSLPRPIFASSTYYLGMVERTYSDTGVYLTETLSVPSVGATIQKSKDIPSNTTTTTHLYSDALESTVLTIDSTGGIEKDIAYYPYGTFHSPSSPLLKTDIRYTGQRSDDSTDLYYYNARYYNPVTAHFISADKAEGPNRYSYVANNPIMRNDPTGHTVCTLGNCPFWLGQAIETTNQFPKTPKVPRSGKDWLKSSFAHLTSLLGFGSFLSDNYKGFVSRDFAASSEVANVVPQPMAMALGANVSRSAHYYGRLLERTESASLYVNHNGVLTKVLRSQETGIPDIVGEIHMRTEIEILEQFNGGLLPKYYGKVPGGYSREFIDGVPLSDFVGKLPESFRTDALNELRELIERGFRDYDIHDRNIIVEIGLDGKPTRLRLIDPLGSHLVDPDGSDMYDYFVETLMEWEELRGNGFKRKK